MWYSRKHHVDFKGGSNKSVFVNVDESCRELAFMTIKAGLTQQILQNINPNMYFVHSLCETFLSKPCDKTIVEVWLSLDTKTTWLGLRKLCSSG